MGVLPSGFVVPQTACWPSHQTAQTVSQLLQEVKKTPKQGPALLELPCSYSTVDLIIETADNDMRHT